MRSCIISFAAVAVFLHVTATDMTLCAVETDDQPNVLFIAIDDLNDWVGFLDGHPQALTPNIDRLAARGIAFTNAHCASPACNPSRAAIFSGKMPWKTNVWSNDSKKLFTAQPDIQVLPHSFVDAGYQTYGTGKMMHSGTNANKQMFQHHFGVEQRWSPFTKAQVQYSQEEQASKGTNNPRHVVPSTGHFKDQKIVLPLNRMPSDRNPTKQDGESFDWGPIEIPDSAMGDTQITNWAIEQLKILNAAKEKSPETSPFFLGVGYYRPHIPLFAPAKYFDRFKDVTIELPAFKEDDLNDLGEPAKEWALEAVTAGSHATVVENKQWEEAVKAYLACTTFVDAQIGRLLDALDAGAFGDNTIIVLWSDHGWHLGEKQHWGKWTGWERSTRVPLIIVPPKCDAKNYAKPGSRCNQPVCLIDLYPTLIELCALKAREDLDGESLVSLLRSPEAESGRVVVTSFTKGNVALRNQRWRLIRYADESQELYDLENDPNEWTNLAEDPKFRDRLKELGQKIPAAALRKAE